MLDNLSTGRREYVPHGVRLHVGDIRRGRRPRPRLRRGPPRGVLPPRRAGGRWHLRRRARLRRRGQRARDAARARGGATARGAGRVQLDRRRDLRRVRRPGAGGCAATAAFAVRHGQARRRGVPRDLEPAPRHDPRRASLRQRLRAAPGGGSRGRRGRDLPRADGGGRDEHDLRRRLADPRLRLRRRRGAAPCWPPRGATAASSTSARGPSCRSRRSTRRAAASPASTARRSTRPPAPETSCGACSTPASPPRELGWRPETSLEAGLAETWSWIRDR